MIRTNTVQLSVIPAYAYRHKLKDGGSGITILRKDTAQPGIASISKTSGEAIPSANTDTKLYPAEAFAEAMTMTNGMPYKNKKNVKMEKAEIIEVKDEPAEKQEEEVIINSDEYQMIVDKYSDKNGKLSYALMNKDFIKFAHSSKIVRDMTAEGKSAASIRNYIISNKFKNITGNDDLTSKELKKIVELLDEVSPKGVYKELNDEIRKMLGKAKK